MPAVAHYSLKMHGCCVSFGFSADSFSPDIRTYLINCTWATMKGQDTVHLQKVNVQKKVSK